MLLKKISDIESVKISHGNSEKFVFENLGFSSNTFTQSAIGKMNKKSTCNLHKHETMIEIFYFISGRGVYTVDGNDYKVSGGSYLRIDPFEIHGLKSISNDLTFFYLGIPTN